MAAKYTTKEVKSMEINELIALLEKKLGRQLSPSTQLLLAMAHGASKAGDSVRTVNLDSGEVREEAIDYEKVAEILNGPDRELMKPYDGPKVLITDPEHFARLVLFAIEHTPSFHRVREIRDLDPYYKSPIESLVECLQFLTYMAKEYEPTGYHFKVYPDGEHSIYFNCYDGEGNFVFNGGILLHP